MTKALLASQTLRWQRVPQRAVMLAGKCAAARDGIAQAIEKLPYEGFLDLWYEPYEKAILLNFGDWADREVVARWEEACRPHATRVVSDYEIGRPAFNDGGTEWVKLAQAPPGTYKSPYRPWLRELLNWGAVTPDRLGWIPGVPSPLSAMLASGMLGAGAGYGTGWVLEKVLPEQWKRKRLRRSLALLGGLAGAAPGALWGTVNVARKGLPGLVSGEPFDTPPQPLTRPPEKLNSLALEQLEGIKLDGLYKEALGGFVDEAGAFPPSIDAQKLLATIYAPPVAQQLPPRTQAAAAGLAVGASHIQGGGRSYPRLVSPMSMAKMTAGMGSGWLSGWLVGKVLSALTGMPESTQQTLRRAGLYAGAIANIVPIAFPRQPAMD